MPTLSFCGSQCLRESDYLGYVIVPEIKCLDREVP